MRETNKNFSSLLIVSVSLFSPSLLFLLFSFTDKASIIRLTISYLKLREFSSNGHPDWSLNVTGSSHKSSATKLCKQSKSTFLLPVLLLFLSSSCPPFLPFFFFPCSSSVSVFLSFLLLIFLPQ